jgi:hypothetical protein
MGRRPRRRRRWSRSSEQWVADYRRLKPANLTGTLDQTGLNTGNFTISLDISSVSNIPQIECYHMKIDGPIGFGLRIFIGATNQWDYVAQGWQNGWDPSEPMILNPSDTVYLFSQAASTLTPVQTATMWFRYDTNLPGNPAYSGS